MNCDDCFEEIEHGWMRNTGEDLDGLPVVKIYCVDCYEKRYWN